MKLSGQVRRSLSGDGNEYKAKEQGGVNRNQNIGTEKAIKGNCEDLNSLEDKSFDLIVSNMVIQILQITKKHFRKCIVY